MTGHHGRDRMVVRFKTTKCNHCLSLLKLWVRIPLKRGVLDTTLSDKVCQWLSTGLWYSPGTPVSSTNKTDRHDIAEILLKVVLNTITLIPYTPILHDEAEFIQKQNNYKTPSIPKLLWCTYIYLFLLHCTYVKGVCKFTVNVCDNWKPFCATKVLLVALIIVKITLNVIVRQMHLNHH
jgi:hypothetical protein